MREDVRHTPIQRSTVEGHGSARAGGKVGSSSGGSAWRGWPEVESLRVVLKRAMEVKVQPVDVQIKETGPGEFDTVGCEAGHSENEHARCRTVAGSVETNAAVFSTTTSGRGSRTPGRCERRFGAVGSRKTSDGGGTSIQAHLQERRFRPKLRGIAGVDCRKTGRFERGDVGGETRRCRGISNIMCHAAQQWQREVAVGMFPSMVTNSAS